MMVVMMITSQLFALDSSGRREKKLGAIEPEGGREGGGAELYERRHDSTISPHKCGL